MKHLLSNVTEGLEKPWVILNEGAVHYSNNEAPIYEIEIWANPECTERLTFPFTLDKNSSNVYIKFNVNITDIPNTENKSNHISVSGRCNISFYRGGSPGGLIFNPLLWFASEKQLNFYIGEIYPLGINSHGYNTYMPNNSFTFNSIEDCQFGEQIN